MSPKCNWTSPPGVRKRTKVYKIILNSDNQTEATPAVRAFEAVTIDKGVESKQLEE
jgi:hypothetical protein